MEFTAQQIADFLHGEVQGDSSIKVHTFAKIEEGTSGTLSFLSNPKYSHYIYDSNASIILVNKDFRPEKKIKATLIRVENAYESLARLLALVESTVADTKVGISPLSFVSESAKLGEDVYIEPFAVIGENVVLGKNVKIYSHCSIANNTRIGDDSILYSGVRIYKNCVIGNNCILHSGAVIGGDGFGFAPTEDGKYQKIPQVGNVIIEDNVEIGANATVDRATIGSTVIKAGVKLDNLVQIAHNVEVGENTVIASQSGVAGSTKIGKHCMLAGQTGIAGHLHIADGTILGAQAGVAGSIKQPNEAYQGTPAVPVRIFRRASVVYKNLPEIQTTISQLEKRIKELEIKLNSNN